MLRENLLNIECEVRRGVGLMRLDGELIAESRYEPERILREWLEAGVVRAIIGFEKVTHIDSAGLSTLLGALHRFRRLEGDLILAELNPALNSIFETTSMERYFKIFGDLEGARRYLRPPPPVVKPRKAVRTRKSAKAAGKAVKKTAKTIVKKPVKKPARKSVKKSAAKAPAKRPKRAKRKP